MTGHPVFGEPSDVLPLVPRPGSYAIALDPEGRIATVRVPKGPHLPGGGREAGESAEEALLREIREEIARAATVVAAIGRADLHAASPAEGACFLKQGSFFEVALGDRLHDVQPEYDLEWMTPERFERESPDPSHVWALRRFLARAESKRGAGARRPPS